MLKEHYYFVIQKVLLQFKKKIFIKNVYFTILIFNEINYVKTTVL